MCPARFSGCVAPSIPFVLRLSMFWTVVGLLLRRSSELDSCWAATRWSRVLHALQVPIFSMQTTIHLMNTISLGFTSDLSVSSSPRPSLQTPSSLAARSLDPSNPSVGGPRRSIRRLLGLGLSKLGHVLGSVRPRKMKGMKGCERNEDESLPLDR